MVRWQAIKASMPVGMDLVINVICLDVQGVLPCFGVFQSKMSQAVYMAAMSQQSVQNM
jgi:hypothetical protein